MDIGPAAKISSRSVSDHFILPGDKLFYLTIKMGLKNKPARSVEMFL
jgi:hypothetical protein